MARFRSRGMALRPVNRIKHVVDSSGTIAKAAVQEFGIATATDTPTLGNIVGVETGAKINGFYIRLEVASNDPIDTGIIPNCYMYVWKNVGGNLTTIAPNAVGSSDNKRYVIHQEMSMIENKGEGSNARTLFNGVVAVPKGMRRMGPDDQWQAIVLCPTNLIRACIQCHYKEFR